MYLGIYLIIGFIWAHYTIRKADKKIQAEVETNDVSSDASKVIEESNRIQEMIGYKAFLFLTYALLTIFWLPAAVYQVFKKVSK